MRFQVSKRLRAATRKGFARKYIDMREVMLVRCHQVRIEPGLTQQKDSQFAASTAVASHQMLPVFIEYTETRAQYRNRNICARRQCIAAVFDWETHIDNRQRI